MNSVMDVFETCTCSGLFIPRVITSTIDELDGADPVVLAELKKTPILKKKEDKYGIVECSKCHTTAFTVVDAEDTNFFGLVAKVEDIIASANATQDEHNREFAMIAAYSGLCWAVENSESNTQDLLSFLEYTKLSLKRIKVLNPQEATIVLSNLRSYIWARITPLMFEQLESNHSR